MMLIIEAAFKKLIKLFNTSTNRRLCKFRALVLRSSCFLLWLYCAVKRQSLTLCLLCKNTSWGNPKPIQPHTDFDIMPTHTHRSSLLISDFDLILFCSEADSKILYRIGILNWIELIKLYLMHTINSLNSPERHLIKLRHVFVEDDYDDYALLSCKNTPTLEIAYI